MSRKMRRRNVPSHHGYGRRTTSLQLTLICLLVFCLLAMVPRVVTAQERREAEEPPDTVLELSEEERAEEEPSNKRRLFDFDLPSFPEEERPEEVKKPSEVVVPPTSASEEPLRETVRQLQQEVELLREEIAALRSELRSFIPEASEKDADRKRKITPFWITDVQLGEREPG